MFTTTDFENLAAIRNDICVSMFSPTHRAGFYEEDRIRFKNVLKETRATLKERGLSEKDAEDFLEKAYDLLDNDDFWENRSDGLAVFITDDSFQTFACPVDFKPFSYVHDHFYLRPTLPMLTGDKKFYLLTLSQKQIKLYEGEKYTIAEIDIDDKVPTNAEEVLGAVLENEQLQHHYSGNTGDGTIFHGQGIGEDDTQEEIKKYFREVDKGINEILAPVEYPLVIAGVEKNVALYRHVSDHPKIWDKPITGNVDEEDPVLLHERAVQQLESYFNEERTKYFEQFSEFMAKDKASFSLLDIVKAAKQGKIAALFVNRDEMMWGTYDADTAEATVHEEPQPESVDLLNTIAVQTFTNSGEVFNVAREHMPQATANANAIFRY